jgi:hypothetical protein
MNIEIYQVPVAKSGEGGQRTLTLSADVVGDEAVESVGERERVKGIYQ